MENMHTDGGCKGLNKMLFQPGDVQYEAKEKIKVLVRGQSQSKALPWKNERCSKHIS